MLISVNFEIFIVLIFTTIIFSGFAYLLIFHKRPKAHFLKKVGENYELVKSKSFKLKNKTIKYIDDIYNLDLTKAIRWKKGKAHLFFEIGNVNPLSFNPYDNIKDSQMLNRLTDNKIISSMFGKQTEKFLILIIMVLVMALMISVSFNMYVVQNPEQFINVVENTTNTVRIAPVIP